MADIFTAERRGFEYVSKPYVLVSLCLLGIPCRYHGKTIVMGHRIGRPALIKKLEKTYNLLPLCPEQLGGLSTPRPPCQVFMGKVIDKTGKDVTLEYNKGAKICLEQAQRFNVKKAYLLKNSPACGKGYGILAMLLVENDITVIPI